MKKTITCLAPWFGAARMIAMHVGEELAGCSWVGVPFAGGMPELLQINARTIVASDKHGWIINLARCVADPITYNLLRRHLIYTPFHPTELKEAQAYCSSFTYPPEGSQASVTCALKFFICAWMGRSGLSGTDGEFRGNLAMRWDASGGDSCTRFRSAIKALADWRRVFQRCTFHVMDAFEFLKECHDKPGIGIYVDPPWPDDGDSYRHKFTSEQQALLAEKLATFTKARVVIRYGDHPLIRKLYPEDRWTWRPIAGRTQANNTKHEVLILNGASRAIGYKEVFDTLPTGTILDIQ